MNAAERKGRCARRLGSALLALSLAATAAGEATIKVDGLGWLGDREAEQSLALLLDLPKRETLDAGQLEDAALILLSTLNDAGYLAPELTVRFRDATGEEREQAVDGALSTPLPRPLEVTEARMHIKEGPRFQYRQIDFEGLTALTPAAARTFFRGEPMLISLPRERLHSPGRLARSLANLREELRQRGFAEARVRVVELQREVATGDVRLRVAVEEGPEHRVASLECVVRGDAPQPPATATADRLGRPWSALWEQDLAAWLRQWYYQRGYPDVQVRVRTDVRPAVAGGRAVAVVAEIAPGPQVRLGEVRFTGNGRTNERTLRRLVRVRDGDLFNPVAFDNGQARLSRLGIFRSIEMAAVPVDDATRDMVYDVAEGRREELSFLAGWGSYEQLRGGFEWRHFNLWGRAHTDNLQVVQSMKSSRGRYTYTVPELFGTTLDGSARLFGLHREELSFTRDEFGGNVSVQWPWRALHAQLTTGYTLQRFRITDNELATEPTDLKRTNSSSINFGFVRDRRDNPLTPLRGSRLFAQLELASRWLGGEVDYQQMRLGASYHTALGAGRWLHAAAVHGLVLTLGADDRELPVSVRFFPGGADSIRGYNEGEAAPRAASGEFVGAKSFLQLNVEVEQALAANWSAVVFVDALGIAARVADYPSAEELYSAGLGIRYRTPIGPVRLEYGHNLNRRTGDPSGTWHLSIGVPF